jgi:drug/metabolite transporter (DMT)-like permease
MEYLFLAIICIANPLQNILTKQYNKKAHGGALFLSAMSALSACISFIVINRDWSYNPGQIFYSIAFALTYCTAVVFSILAIKTGPLAITNLIISCFLFIPTGYGIIFLKEPITVPLIIGLLLLVVSLVMVNYQKDTDVRPSLKWLIFAILACVGNGFCSTVQKMNVIAYGESGKNMFMIVALVIVSAALIVMMFSSKDERLNLRHNAKVGWHHGALRGVANAIVNALVLILNTMLPASVIFPVVSAAAMVIIFAYSTVFAKEKYSAVQKVGFAFGIVSIVLLNL